MVLMRLLVAESSTSYPGRRVGERSVPRSLPSSFPYLLSGLVPIHLEHRESNPETWLISWALVLT